MRSASATVMVAALAWMSACSSSEDDSITTGGGDSSSAVTVAGAESVIVEQGDDRPQDEDDAASVVSVTVDLPPEIDLAGVAIVALEDITVADSEAITIASVEVPVAQLLEQDNRVDVFLPLPLDGSIDVTATVHIDVDENGTFSQGDWISPELALVTPATQFDVTVTMVQI